MSDELVVLQPNESALVAAATNSSWGDEEEEIKPRYIQIKNPKSIKLEKYPNGHFVDNKIGRSWDTLDLIILGVRLTRKLQAPYVEGSTTARELHCRSVNRKVPVTNDDRFTPKGVECGTCAFGPPAWARFNRKTGEGKPQNPCEQEVEILFIEKANPRQPYIYIVNGKARGVAEDMYSAIKALSKDTGERTGHRPEVYEYIVTLTSERQGANYYPKFTQIKELTQDEAAIYGSAYREFVVARREAYQARQGAADVQNELEAHQEVVETPAAPATKPLGVVLPPASKRVVGTKPVYKTPVLPGDENEPATTVEV